MSTHDDATEHLAAARNYLAIADDGFALQFEEPRTVAEREAFATQAKTRLALALAEQHRAVAEAIWLSMPGTIEVAPDPEQQTRARIAKDVAAHDAVQVRPSTDPEPDGGEGDLWTTGDGWFWYAVNGCVTAPLDGVRYANRWLLIRHYAQFLRWRDETRTKPIPHTWPELANVRAPGEDKVVLRRPTDTERATFYGPEPDPAPVDTQARRVEAFVADQANRAGYTITETAEPEDVTPGWVHIDGAGVAGLTGHQLADLRDQLQHELVRRAIEPPPREELPSEQGPPNGPGMAGWRPRGGAAQWREG